MHAATIATLPPFTYPSLDECIVALVADRSLTPAQIAATLRVSGLTVDGALRGLAERGLIWPSGDGWRA